MGVKVALSSALIMLAGATLAAEPAAIQLYRYVDRNGVTVIDRQGVPPEYAGKGYDILSEQGRVIKIVPPAPPAEELHRRAAARLQAQADAKLLRLYSSVADVDRARQRKLSELDGLAAIKRSNLQSLDQQRATLMAQAAEHQRAGRTVPDDLLQRIDALRAEESRLNSELERYAKERQETEASYQADRERLVQLLGK
ncbi:uncharacterized protein DUF4124 [Pseudomonas duriflava]|uniref:Uncharacterized protein DUF4124 n=1 Tax=Pseudomonas duriflava TaxID=459528 RepID=A0A562QLP6_9PSED|nr:DUF4124 domain-containing protein [Pseudomonas duriflava]TWI57593.1 uncharacterized protein DUF4124 [Pseudomonas duriflava]